MPGCRHGNPEIVSVDPAGEAECWKRRLIILTRPTMRGATAAWALINREGALPQ
jgi:hypothetical protein